MKKIINLYWYVHPEGHGNFGDEASPYIIEKLSGKQVKHFNIKLLSKNRVLILKILLKNLYLKTITINEFFNYFSFRFFGVGKVILSIGSILTYKEDSRFHIWGSGIMNKSTNFGNANFVAVRGYRTISKLKELDYKAPNVVGDPALLLPIIYKPKSEKRFKLGIIPHYVHYEELKKLGNDEIKIINLFDKVEDVIDDINSCKHTVSTSLHGIIVSHAYRIPSIWIAFQSENKLRGDDIKFDDYFSSVEINAYEPYKINLDSFNLEDTLQYFKYNDQFLTKEGILQKIQNDLIKVAPFFVEQRFKS